ncbi:MmpS family transport accessory protein [Micromonospora sp. C28SCA-DRY-2]|uniref:MmpS family transport accessory protein n=1 Tax=Micromonospora sp. C28SCA-DRY-2 TaxID=3059522 RepID=UPI002675BFEF|nr:MmpS family transport accessory protein [Micromonospora sp. C28SCA-DRY-2]MDO3702529.1 MmpS family transport accessory protein [Micromonospora sp. C28SCA-DRY-2]
MSEAPPPPDPTPSTGPAAPDPGPSTGPAAPDAAASGTPTAPEPAAPPSWTPPDPTPPPQPWVAPDPWTPPGTPGLPPPAGAPGPAWYPPGHLPPGYLPPGHLPPGYPPPYAPAAPARSGNRSTVVGVVVAVATVLAFGLCACLGIAGLVYSADTPYPDDPYAQETYDPYYDYEEPQVWPTQARPTVRPALTPSDGPGRVTVVYEVTGRGPADLEYYDANGDFIQVEQVTLPWRRSLRMPSAERVMVLADHGQPDRISCRITVDGRTVATDEGAYGVNCTG